MSKKTVVGLICISLAAVKLSMAGTDSDTESKKLVGIWQASDVMPAAWAKAYQFFSDGKFVFNASQENHTSRERNFSGTWALTDGKLILLVKQKTVMEGGKIIDDNDPILGRHLEGAKQNVIPINPPEKKVLRMGRITIGKNGYDGSDMLTVKIGDSQYWKFDDDPRRYP